MSSSSKVVLYGYWRSSCSWRVRIALNLKKIDFEYVAVPLLENAQSAPDYVEKNPSAEVPTLEIDGQNLAQSLAILEYLEETRPDQGARLLPTDPVKRAQARQIAMIIASNTQPLQNLRVLKKVGELGGEAEKKKWANDVISRNFAALEKILAKTSGKYCVGDEVSIADLCLVPQLYGARRFDVDLSQFPLITKIESSLEVLDEFKRAHANVQPDATP